MGAKPYVYLPNKKGKYLFLDYKGIVNHGVGIYWHVSGDYLISKEVIPPWYILAVYDEASKTLHIRYPRRFRALMNNTKDSLKSFMTAMGELGIEPITPLVTVDNREGNSSQEHDRLVAAVNEQAREYARRRSYGDKNDSSAGRLGANNNTGVLQFWPCGWCKKEYDCSYQCCPSPGCPGIKPATRRRLGKARQRS